MSKNLFKVTKLQLHTGMENFASPSAFAIFKTTGGQALGVVGKDFTPTQPQFLYDQFAECISARELDPSKISFQELHGGKKIIIKSQVKEFTMKNAVKKNDALSFEACLTTGYDGKTQTSMFINVERLICTNGMKALNTEFQVKFKNVRGNIGKANMLCNDLTTAINSIEELQAQYTRLAARKITKKEHEDFIFKVTGMKLSDYAQLTARKQRILDSINESVAIEMKSAGSTAWALMNGITHFTNHVASPRNGNTTDFLYVDSGLFLNNKAQRFALELLN